MRSILFVCSGNIFRSLVAEYALKALVDRRTGYVISSAGIEAVPQPVHPIILERLREKGADATRHIPRRLTRDLLEAATLPVAMGLDHREFISREFQREVPLFNEVCFQRPEPILDVGEAVPDWEVNGRAARDYALSVVDYIWDAMPLLVSRLLRTED
jgi:protein-tyrosine phosphatase